MSPEYTPEQLKLFFITFYLDHSGSLEISKIQHVFALLGETPNEETLDAMIGIIDVRSDFKSFFRDP